MTPTIPVTIIIPTHFRPSLLNKTLTCIAGQTYPAHLLSAIVVASDNDPALDLIEKRRPDFPFPLRCVTIPDDRFFGRSASAKRNFGADLATTPWIAFTDDDCLPAEAWIAKAAEFFAEAADVAAIEGGKHIPPPPTRTLTYKGLLLLAKPGGYQTCNMLYRRRDFLRLGGFDLTFPFYLEDTDLAWTFLGKGLTIAQAPKALVEHPVLPPAPWRMLAAARRTILLPYLYRKHPALYRRTPMRPLGRAGLAYLAVYGLWLSVVVLLGEGAVLPGLFALVGLVAIHSAKLFWRCDYKLAEVAITTLLLPVVPVVAVIQLLRGQFRYKTRIKPFWSIF